MDHAAVQVCYIASRCVDKKVVKLMTDAVESVYAMGIGVLHQPIDVAQYRL